jgi:hypothetical protein
MDMFPQNESARVIHEVRQRRIACRKRLRRQRAVPKNGSCEMSGPENIAIATRTGESKERREAEDCEGLSKSAEALDEACAGIRG